MKKSIFILIILLPLTHFSAKEMQLYRNFTGAQEFSELTLEEQYASYMNSFRYLVDPREQPLKWAKRMVEQYGRDVLSLIDKELETASFDNVYSYETDDQMSLIAYILSDLSENNYLRKDEKILYAEIYESKIEEYILKYNVIDNTVRVAMACISYFSQMPSYFADKEKMKEYYEKKLGVTGLQVVEYRQYLK